MIKIFKAINRYLKTIINILLRLFLGAIYFILLFPFAILAKLFADFLDIKNYATPSWIPHNKVENIEEFLRQQ